MSTYRFMPGTALAGLGVCLLLGLAGCQPTSNADSDADFYVASNGQGRQSGYTVQGWGWKPGSKVSVQIFNEPTGPGVAATQWKHILDVNVDPYSMFGFTGSATFYPVPRNICGQPENGQFMLVLLKSDTGRIRMRQVPVDLYFTFVPC